MGRQAVLIAIASLALAVAFGRSTSSAVASETHPSVSNGKQTLTVLSVYSEDRNQIDAKYVETGLIPGHEYGVYLHPTAALSLIGRCVDANGQVGERVRLDGVSGGEAQDGTPDVIADSTGTIRGVAVSYLEADDFSPGDGDNPTVCGPDWLNDSLHTIRWIFHGLELYGDDGGPVYPPPSLILSLPGDYTTNG
jgi:hypothetical protein